MAHVVNDAPGPIRLVVSDVDGTMVTNDKRLTNATVDAAQRLAAAGIRLALTSSRPPCGLEVIARRLGLDTPLGAFNGGTIVAADGTVIESRLVPEAAARRCVELLEAEGVDVWFFAGRGWQLRNPDGDYVPLERHTIEVEPEIVASFEPLMARTGKVVGASRDFELLTRCEARLQAEFRGLANVHKSQDYYLDITHPEASKAVAVRAIAEHLGIPLAETAAIGDMGNDVPMFGVAGLAIAMGNAPPAVQAKAQLVSTSNEADGWAHAMDEFVLPRAAGRMR